MVSLNEEPRTMIKIAWILGLFLTVLFILIHAAIIRKKSNQKKPAVSVQLHPFQKWIARITILSFVVLFIIGAFAVIFSGRQLTGSMLLIHLSAAPIFAAGFAILVFQLAPTYPINEHNTRYSLLLMILFWLSSVLVLPVILSIVLSMFTRVSSLFLVIAAILFLYFSFINRKSKSIIN